MIDQSILQQLKESSLKSGTDLINSYVDNEDQIVQKIANFKGLKSEFYCKEPSNAIETIKFLSIYSDFSSIFMMPNNTDEYSLHYYPPGDKRFRTRKVIFPKSVVGDFVPDSKSIIAAYMTHNNKSLSGLTSSLASFIDGGRVMIRPVRSLMVHQLNDKNQILYVNSDTPSDEWRVKEMNENDSFLIDNGIPIFHTQLLYEITLPFIDGLSTDTLSQILTDETDILSGFRANLKRALLDIKDIENLKPNEFYNDTLRPEVDKINRKFRTIQNIHRLGIAATFTAFTLSLIAIKVTPEFNFQTIFGVLAPSTLGIIGSEIRYQNEEEKLKDNPYFLLWKINKSKKI